ncbi:MAG: tryptophan-rich sensory protein [Aphanocapsa sp. GSE-SYN-MK-11-07L]|jgi:tryptophan-rich sensory protein|nr:tryptophan-rich sensory protein [Aphanocapsa sp. GSE-SYN-MK-11-07L]
MNIPSWLPIAVVAVLLAALSNLSQTKRDFSWFRRLRRPRWLSFEWAIPFIWISILACAAWSAVLVWNTAGDWWLMGCYVLLELLILAYTPVMCKLHSLRVGTLIGAIGFGWGCFLTLQVFQVSRLAAGLLVPYLLWSPIGTFVTWQMIRLNPREA